MCVVKVQITGAGRAGPSRDAHTDHFSHAEWHGDRATEMQRRLTHSHTPDHDATGSVPGSEMDSSVSRSPSKSVVLVGLEKARAKNLQD